MNENKAFPNVEPRPSVAVELMGERAISEAVAEAAARFLSEKGDRPLCVVGLATRGVPLARRLAAKMKELGVEAGFGSIDPSFYRDDYHTRIKMPSPDLPTPQNLDGAGVILVDDVMYTGRSVRAALTALLDLGRPAFVRLWVLVDRPGRERPSVPDLSGMCLEGRVSGEVRVRLKETDGEDVVLLTEGKGE